MASPTLRRFVHPTEDDTLVSIAARELPGLAAEDALAALQSWNLHVLVRPLPGMPPEPCSAATLSMSRRRPRERGGGRLHRNRRDRGGA